MSIDATKDDPAPQERRSFTKGGCDDRTYSETPIARMILDVRDESIDQIIARGQAAELRFGIGREDNAHLATGLSKLADFGNLSPEVAAMIRAAAGRLAQNNVPRDLWKRHVPKDSRIEAWELLEYKSFGTVSRYTLKHGNRETGAVVLIMMIDNSGALLEGVRTVDPKEAERLIDFFLDQQHRSAGRPLGSMY